MKNPNTKEDERKADRRVTPDRRSSSAMRAATGDRREMENRGVVAAMGDALEDILAWERASERSLKAADAVASTTDVNTSR